MNDRSYHLKEQITSTVLEMVEKSMPYILLKHQQSLEDTDLKLKQIWSIMTYLCYF